MQIAAVVLLAVLIGLTLGAVGGGGSILAVPVLVGVAGLAVTEATTASLIVVGTASGIGLLAALRSGTVRPATGVAFGVAGVGGAALGTHLNRGMDEGVLLIAFAVLMAVVATRMLRGLAAGTPRGERAALSLTSRKGEHDPVTPANGSAPADPPHGTSRAASGGGAAVSATSKAARILLAGTLVGFLTGLFGVGGGFVIVPALMFLLGFDIRGATATSLLVIAINSAVALLLRADMSTVDWGVVAPFTLFAVGGVLSGRTVADHVPARTLTAALTVLISAMALWTAVQGVGQFA